MLKNSMLRSILGGAALQRRGRVISRPNAASLPVILLALLLSTTALAEDGADSYKARCSACHGVNGAGDTMLGKNLKLRSLASPAVQEQSDQELAAVISQGKNKMPAYDHKLSRNQIADVVQYIRSLKK